MLKVRTVVPVFACVQMTDQFVESCAQVMNGVHVTLSVMGAHWELTGQFKLEVAHV